MWFLLPLGVLGTMFGVLAYKARNASAAPAPSTAAAAQMAADLTFLMDVILRLARGTPDVAPSGDQRSQAAAIAQRYGMVKSAQGILNNSGLSNDEMWPGTNQTVGQVVASAWSHSQYNPTRQA